MIQQTLITDILNLTFLELDLSQIESKVYFALLDKKDFNLSALAAYLGVDRSKIYLALDRLEKLEIISKISRSNWVAQPPAHLIALLRFKEGRTNKVIDQLEDILPDLTQQYQQYNRSSTIKTYEGRKQFINLFNQVLDEAKDEVLGFLNVDYFFDLVDYDFHQEWSMLRAKKEIKSRVLVFPTPKMDWFNKRNKEQLRELKWLPPNYVSKGSFYIYGSKIIQWDPVLPKAIVIDNSVIAQTQKSLFETLWGLLPKSEN